MRRTAGSAGSSGRPRRTRSSASRSERTGRRKNSIGRRGQEGKRLERDRPDLPRRRRRAAVATARRVRDVVRETSCDMLSVSWRLGRGEGKRRTCTSDDTAADGGPSSAGERAQEGRRAPVAREGYNVLLVFHVRDALHTRMPFHSPRRLDQPRPPRARRIGLPASRTAFYCSSCISSDRLDAGAGESLRQRTRLERALRSCRGGGC